MKKITKFFLRWFKNNFITSYSDGPKDLILYVTSTCNQKCSHCYYSAELNQKTDLTFKEYEKISKDLGVIESILIGGGEPFTRKDFAEIIGLFYKNNNTKRFGIPTNCTLYKRMNDVIRKVIASCPEITLAINVSIDGLEKTHNEIRKYPDAFNKALKNLDLLLNDFNEYNNISFSITSTIMKENSNEVSRLRSYIEKKYKHKVGISWNYVRDINKSYSELLPEMKKLEEITFTKFRPKKNDNFFSRMLTRVENEIRFENIEKRKQSIPCVAGKSMGVIYANGDISSCEMLPAFANFKSKKDFIKIWDSSGRKIQRKMIASNGCSCTHECFIGPSFVGNKLLPIYALKLLVKNLIREYKLSKK